MRDCNVAIHLIFIIATTIAAWHFTELRFALTREHPPAGISLLVEGAAHTPFQYRVLVPWIAGGIERVLKPSSIVVSRYLLFQIIEFLSVIGLIVAFRRFIFIMLQRPVISSLLGFSLFFILPFNYLFPRELPLWYPWDMPGLFLFTLGLLFLYQDNKLFYYILFPIATLNRETTVFLILIYLLSSIAKEQIRSIALHCLAQCVVWFSIKYALFLLYEDNPGSGLLENHLIENLRYLIDLENIPSLLSSMGFLWIPVIVWYDRLTIQFLKRSLLVLIPFLGGVMCVANIYEMRVYGEMIPVVSLACVGILTHVLKDRQSMKGSSTSLEGDPQER